MSQLCNIAKCKDCDAKNPNGDNEFCVVLEWLKPEDIKKKIDETKCPNCGSKNWYLTDATEH